MQKTEQEKDYGRIRTRSMISQYTNKLVAELKIFHRTVWGTQQNEANYRTLFSSCVRRKDYGKYCDNSVINFAGKTNNFPNRHMKIY